MLYEFLVYFTSFCVLLKIFAVLTKGVAKSHTCLVGKTVLITGANRGLGFEAALALAARGCRLIIADKGIGYETALALAARGCRLIIADKDDATETKQKIIAATNNENVVTRSFDLTSFDSIRDFAEDINKSESRLDILINNAGVGFVDQVYLENNNQNITQINHLGPFLLTHLLIGLLERTANSRVIFVSSFMAFINNLTLENMNKIQKSSMFAYGNAKLCNAITTKVLAKRLDQSKITVNCLHPGLVNTAIWNLNLRSFCTEIFFRLIIIPIVTIYGKTPEEGAQCSIDLALSGKFQSVSGKYFSYCRQFWFPRKAYDEAFCEAIFEKSERLVGLLPNEILPIKMA